MALDYTTEKKLRPLYEALDEGQNKQALQYAMKLLKKTPDWPLVKALKALALSRSGKEEEAIEICQQIKKVIPTDEPTLQATTMVLRELGKNSLIVDLYENAANIQPKNEEFAIQWFMAMVRNNDYKGQQAAAVKLHRLFKQNKYLFWAIMSLALQGQNGNKLSYVLAERMMAKALEEKRLEEVEQLRLYLLILMDQNKNKEALTLLLDTPLGHTALRDPEVRQIKSELLRHDQRWTEAMLMSQEALEENADDWFHWLAYFDSMDALLQDNDKVIQQAETLITHMKSTVLNSKFLKRGPFLAELELDHRLSKIGKREEQIVLDHIVSYFRLFGSKNCCYEDLQSYVLFLRSNKDKAIQFIESLSTNEDSTIESVQVKNVHKNVNIQKLAYLLTMYDTDSVQDTIDSVNRLWHAYESALPLGVDLKSTEVQYGDDFVIIAAQLLVNLYNTHRQPSHLIQAASLLEIALKNSIHNYQLKLLLVRIYAMLGVSKRPFDIFRTMEIKQIQFDTMIHYFTDRFISLGCADDLSDLLEDSLFIYKSNEIETPEMLVKAYRYSTYSKIQEFIEFRRRMDHSLQHRITKIELLRIEFAEDSYMPKYGVQFFQEHTMAELDCSDHAALDSSDNRDFKVLANCNAEDSTSFEQTCKPTNSTNSTWVQMFSYILTLISVLCETKKTRDLEALCAEYEVFMKSDEVKTITPSEYVLAQYILSLIQAIVYRTSDPTLSMDKLKHAIQLLHEQNIGTFSEADLGWESFHQLSIALETFNYGSVILEMISRSLGLNSKEAKRKAIETAKTDEYMATFLRLQSQMKQSLDNIQSVCRNAKDLFKPQFQKKLSKHILDSESVVSCFKIKDTQNMFNHHVKIMIQSWNHSITELQEKIDSRIKQY